MLTCLALFYQPDFLNLTVAATGIFIISSPMHTRWSIWRKYVAITALSFFYDMIFLCFISDPSAEN
jgi:hypothetical protein